MKKALLALMCMAAMIATNRSIMAQEVTITISPGWNWISYPRADTMELTTAMGTFTPEEGDMIKSRYGFSEYYENEWFGNLQQFYPRTRAFNPCRKNTSEKQFDFRKMCIFAVLMRNAMSSNDILNQIQKLGREIIPADGHLYLYGSRARGDSRPDSDWDLLILLNKDKEEYLDFDTYSYPFISLGYDYGVSVSAHLYTMDKWDAMSFSPFYHNVEHDKIVLV